MPAANADGAGPEAPLEARIERLLARSLVAWRVIGRVGRDPASGAVAVDALGRAVTVGRAPSGLPFRWLVTVDGRERPAVSVVAVLRQVRLALDPGYAKTRVRIAPMPVMPPQ